jgi:hypothetical protein
MTELFPDLDLGCPSASGDGCARPIGRRRTASPRQRPLRVPRPSMAVLLSEVRGLRAEIGSFTVHLRRIERCGVDQAARGADDSEILANLLRRQTEIERILKLTELHVPPSGHTPRRPLGR